MRRTLTFAVALLATLTALVAPSRAAVLAPVALPGGSGGTNGVATAADGTLWVAEEQAGSVAHITTGGALIQRYAVGAQPSGVLAAAGKVWVAVEGATKLVWFDAGSPAPTAHDVPLAPAGCGPVALAFMEQRIYYSQPSAAAGCTPSISWIDPDNPATPTTRTGLGQVLSLAPRDGKLYAPDFTGGVTRRLDKDLNEEAKLTTAGKPRGVAVSAGGNVHVTDFANSRFYRFTAGENDPAAAFAFPVTPPEGFAGAVGVTQALDGHVFFTASASHQLVRLNFDGTFSFFDTGAGSMPWQVVPGPDGDLYVSDQSAPRLLRFVDGPPRTTTGVATAVAPTAAQATASTDPRGNETTVVFDYGTTTAYGATSAPVVLPAGAGAVPVGQALAGLAPSTTYHVRARASNALGSVIGGDVTVTTPAQPVPPVRRLPARPSFSWAFGRSFTILTKVRIAGLLGGETVRITCATKRRGCPFKAKTFKSVAKGTRKLDKLFRKRRLRKGTKVVVRITRPPAIGSVVTLTTRNGRDPRIVRRCLRPGTSKPSRC